MLGQFFRNDSTKAVDEQIAAVLDRMNEVGVDSEEYKTQMDHLEQLNKIKAQERRDPIKWDTVALVAGNLLGILIIVAYEQKHVFTSKGLSQVGRMK